MVLMKRIFIAFMLVAFLASCSAASIEVYESIPANAVWSFSVNLPDADDFDDAKVFLDGGRLISFYTHNGEIIPESDGLDKSRVFSSTEPINNTVYFLVSPLEKGDHEIELEIDGDTVDEEVISFFEIYDAEGNADLQSQITSLRGNVNSVVEQFNEIKDKLDETLTEEDKRALEQSINNLETDVGALETEFENSSLQNQNRVEVLLEDVTALQARTADLNSSLAGGLGFLSLGSLNQGTIMIIVTIIIAIVAAMLVVRYKDKISFKKGLYGKPRKNKVMFSQHDEDITEQVLNESQDSEKVGKWSFGDTKPVKEERKPFNIGDLLRK